MAYEPSKIAQRVAGITKLEPEETPPTTMALTLDQIAEISRAAVKSYIEAQSDPRKAPLGLTAEQAAVILKQQNAAPCCDMNDRVWIILGDNKNIAKGGQYFGINGLGFLLRPGKKAHVPRALLNVIKDAIEGVAISNPDTLQIEEYREVGRFPYSIVEAP